MKSEIILVLYMNMFKIWIQYFTADSKREWEM